MRDVNEIISRMKESIGKKEDKDLRVRLSLKSTGVITNWRDRKSIPYQHIDQLVQETGRSFEWFLNGKEAQSIVSEQPEIYQMHVLPPDELDLLLAYRSLNDQDKGCALRMVEGLRGLEEQSEKSGERESSCKAVNFG